MGELWVQNPAWVAARGGLENAAPLAVTLAIFANAHCIPGILNKPTSARELQKAARAAAES